MAKQSAGNNSFLAEIKSKVKPVEYKRCADLINNGDYVDGHYVNTSVAVEFLMGLYGAAKVWGWVFNANWQAVRSAWRWIVEQTAQDMVDVNSFTYDNGRNFGFPERRAYNIAVSLFLQGKWDGKSPIHFPDLETTHTTFAKARELTEGVDYTIAAAPTVQNLDADDAIHSEHANERTPRTQTGGNEIMATKATATVRSTTTGAMFDLCSGERSEVEAKAEAWLAKNYPNAVKVNEYQWGNPQARLGEPAYAFLTIERVTQPPAASETPAHESAQDAAFEHTFVYGDYVYNDKGERAKVISVHGNRITVDYEDGYVEDLSAIGLRLAKKAREQHAANTQPQAERGERDAQPLTPENDIHTFMLAERDAKDARIARLEAALEVARKTLSDLKYGNLRPYEVAYAIQDALETIERHNNESEDTTTN